MGSGGGGAAGSDIRWDNPSAGARRQLLRDVQPKVPSWVSTQGLRLRVVVSFSISADGVVFQPRIDQSSGYSDFDANVIDAARLMLFSAEASSPPISGKRVYETRPR